jgi:anti-sigma B factor antagonist
MTDGGLIDGFSVLVSAPQLRNAIASLGGDASNDVVVDLADLTYIDSVGIGLLVASRRRLDSEGRRFTVRNPAPQVLRLLEITGLVEYLGLR